MIVSARLRRRWRSPCQSNSSLITTHLGGRRMPPSAGRKSPAKALQYGSIKRAWGSKRYPRCGSCGTVGLEVIELPGGGSRNEHAPNMAPTVQIGIELDDVRRLGVVDAVVEQDAHGGRTAAEDDELNPSIVYNSTIRKRVRELQRRLPLRHGRRLNGATRVKRNIRSIARIDIKRHLFSPIAESREVGGRPASGIAQASADISTTSDRHTAEDENRGRRRHPFAYR